ncbi:MAG: energy transducer TonB [Pseudomonadota bacterium]
MLRFLPLILFLLSAATAVHAEGDWPARVVGIEDMKPLTRMRIGVPKLRPKGEVRGPVVVRAHVDAQGAVHRVALLESSGSSAHDEAALHAMRAMRFEPKQVDGVPARLPSSCRCTFRSASLRCSRGRGRDAGPRYSS